MNSNDPSALPPSENPQQTPETNLQPPPFFPRLPPRVPHGAAAVEDPYRWVKWLFEQNPFYIASAIMLLYATFRLSTDAKIFVEEISQLFFNFGSFQFYELMLVVTAVVLVRRKILYDFSLLVCIETLFAFVPFILISQALLIESDIAMQFTLAGCVLVLLRFGQLRKYFAGMNFPPRLLLLGGVLLCVNVMLPLLVRYIHMESNALNRDNRMNPLLEGLWLFGAPILAGLAYFLPSPQRTGSHLLQRRTFPLTALSLWVVATCAHLYSIGYIHQVTWSDWYVLPVLWMAAWMFYLRRGDVFEEENSLIRNYLSIPALALTVIAGRHHEWTLFFILNVINAAIYAKIFLQQRNAFSFQLLCMAGAASFAGLPDAIIVHLGIDAHRTTYVGLAITGYLLLQAILSRNPKAGLAGAAFAALASGTFFVDSDYSFHIAVQVGGVFLLIHSLRWVMNTPEVRKLRLFVAALWVLHSILWTASTHDHTAFWATSSFALTVFATYVAIRAIFGAWGSRVVVYAAALVLVSGPAQKLLLTMKGAPVGLLILIASFVLFALGTLLALTRHRWLKSEPVLNTDDTRNQ